MIRFLFLTIVILASGIAANASSTDWQWQIPVFMTNFGTAASASDGWDGLDVPAGGAWSFHVGTYHERGVDGWIGDTGFYSTDMRAPLSFAPGQSKTWRLYLWGDPSRRTSASPLEVQWGAGTWPPPSDIQFTLTYVQAAQGVTGVSLPLGTVVNFNQHTQGTWSFPGYVSADGRTGYVFDFTATVIPEPPCILALAGGLAGLGGFAARRWGTRHPRSSNSEV